MIRRQVLPDDGIVFEIDPREVRRVASLIQANTKLTEALERSENRFDELLGVYLIVSKTVREQDEELERSARGLIHAR